MVLEASLIEPWVSVNCRQVGNIRKASQVVGPHWLPLKNPLQKPEGPFSSGCSAILWQTITEKLCSRVQLLWKYNADTTLAVLTVRLGYLQRMKASSYSFGKHSLHSTSIRKKTLIFLCRHPQKYSQLDFPGGMVDKNPPAIAGDAGSIPGLGRSIYHGATKPVCHNY